MSAFDSNWLRRHEARQRGPHEPTLSAGPAAEREHQLHTAIREACTARGWLFFCGLMGKKSRRTPGEPDFTVIGDGGRVWFIECKAGKNKRDDDQDKVANHAEKMGTTVHIVRCIEDFVRVTEYYENQ